MDTVLMIVLKDFVNDSRILRECATVHNMGYRVVVYALHSESLPEYEKQDNYELYRFKLTTKKWPKHPFIQIFKYLECFIRIAWKGTKLNPKVVHCHDISALPIGFVISLKLKSKLIYDSHELWSNYNYRKSLVVSAQKQLSNILEKFLMRRSDAVITVSDSIANYLSAFARIKKPFVIRNIPNSNNPNIQDINLLKKNLHIPKDKKILLFQGGFASNAGLEDLVAAMELVLPAAVLVFMGGGILNNKLHNLVKRKSLNNKVFFHAYVDNQVLLNYTACASIGISSSSSINLDYRYALPNKLFEYIQAGVPVLVTDLPDMRKIVMEYKIGETYPEGDPQELACIINRLLENPKQLEIYKKNVKEAAKILNWENEENKLKIIYKSLS